MRTALDIDSELLMAAKELARRAHTSAGKVVSRLLRNALAQPGAWAGGTDAREPELFYGFRPFAFRGGVVTNELVDRLRDAEGI